MYLTYKDFNINKSLLQIDCKDSLIVVMFLSKTCLNCVKSKKEFDKLPQRFPNISFALCLVDADRQMLDLMALNQIQTVPYYALFKFGIFNRTLEINYPTADQIYNSLKNELNTKYYSMPKQCKYLSISNI